MKRLHSTASKNFISRQHTPVCTFVLSFALVISTVAVPLHLSFSAFKNHLSFVNALFTSTSTICATGLTVVAIRNTLTDKIQMIWANYTIKNSVVLVAIDKSDDID